MVGVWDYLDPARAHHSLVLCRTVEGIYIGFSILIVYVMIHWRIKGHDKTISTFKVLEKRTQLKDAKMHLNPK